jgi:hypothetical protein
LVFQSCERAEDLVAPEIEIKEAIPAIQKWYARQIQDYAKSATPETIFIPHWVKGVLHTLDNGTRLAVFPVWREVVLRYHEVGFVRRLVVRLDAQNRVIKGEILAVIAPKAYLIEHLEQVPKWYAEDRLPPNPRSLSLCRCWCVEITQRF